MYKIIETHRLRFLNLGEEQSKSLEEKAMYFTKLLRE